MDTRPSVPRAPRRDALRNDRVIIDAARAVFAEQGPQASMEAIASRAGLGVGTIYRRFESKDQLLDAIAQLFTDEIDRAAEAAAASPDPGTGLEQFLEFVGQFNAEKRRFAAELTDRVANDAGARTVERIAELTRNAVQAGVLAPDVTPEDIEELIVALRGVIAVAPESGDRWRRFVHVHLAGLRAGS